MRLPEFIEEWRRARWEVVEQAYARKKSVRLTRLAAADAPGIAVPRQIAITYRTGRFGDLIRIYGNTFQPRLVTPARGHVLAKDRRRFSARARLAKDQSSANLSAPTARRKRR
jgi:hypothetical protein